MTSRVNTDIMELGVMPSQFLNVVIDETQIGSSSNRKKETVTSMSLVSKSVKRALESETTIIPIYSNNKY